MKAKFTLLYAISGIMTLGPLTHSDNTAAQTHNDKHYTIDSTYTLTRDTTATDIAKDWDALLPHAVEALEYKNEVLYVMNTGDTISRHGGTRAWRNNNPGCLVYGDFARQRGAIGKGGKFAVFPDYETGRNALADLLRSDAYRNLSIERAITKYAPPHENNVAVYKKRLRKMTGLALGTKIRDLDSLALNKVADAICVIEGWVEGKTERRPGNGDMMAAAKTKLMRDSMQNTL